MREPIKIPAGGYTIEEIKIVGWNKNIGDLVREGEVLLNYEADKAEMEFNSLLQGVLVEILPGDEGIFRRPEVRPEDQKGGWSALVGWIETEEKVTRELVTSNKEEEKSNQEMREERAIDNKEEKVVQTPVKTSEAEMPTAELPILEKSEGETIAKSHIQVLPTVPEEDWSPDRSFVGASPFVRAVARDKGVNLSKVKGSGPRGLVLLADVINFIESKKGAPKLENAKTEILQETEEYIIEPLSSARKAIAKHMEASKCIGDAPQHAVIVNLKHIIHAKLFAKWNGLYDAIPQDKAKKYLRPEIIVIEGMLRALRIEKNKILNSCFGCEHFEFKGRKIFKNVNLGIAYGLAPNLKVPVLHKMQDASYKEIVEKVDDLYTRIAKGKWRPEEVSGGTITFNNVGALGGIFGKSTVTHGQSAICVLHGIKKNGKRYPHDYGDAFLSLSFDHREFDGLEASGFLEDVREFIEGVDFVDYVIKAVKS